MTFDEYINLDAIGLADLVTRHEVTADELLDVACARLAEVNTDINAVICMLESSARESIKEGLPRGPLNGVPFLLKDLSAQVAGSPMAMGSRVFANNHILEDNAIVKAYRKAGLVIFGKTNTPELGLAATTEPTLFGATHNPWNLELTPGGSSGGAAAAVASGIVPAAHASDGGGSIRIPAACCGLFGLKPSRGRVSSSPAGEGWGGLSAQHVVTRSVRDSALLLDIECQPQPGDPYFLPPPEKTFLEEIERAPGQLRIGFTTAALIWGNLDPQCAQAVKQAATLCEALNHHIEETVVPGNFQMMAMAVNTIVGSSVAALLDQEAERRGTPIQEKELERLTWASYQGGKSATSLQYVAALQTVHDLGRTVSKVFEKYDVLMLSTLGRLPPALGFMDTNSEDLPAYSERLYSFMPNTQPFNVCGFPAMSVPLGKSNDGLPIGIQFVAPYGNEAILFRLAAQLEQAQPWFSNRPQIPVSNSN